MATYRSLSLRVKVDGARLARRRAEPHLPRPRQDGVLDVGAGLLLDRRIDPLAAGVALLAEDAAAHAVGAQLAPEDENVDLEALVGRLGRAVPIGDDDAAEGIGRGQRHEGDGVERGAPEIAVDANAGAARAAIVAALLLV